MGVSWRCCGDEVYKVWTVIGFGAERTDGSRGGLTIWKLGHCPRAWGQ
ncbi:unnamed protein product [Staurois parvus]|uniref:Uncharacterized protein n=1 Tax=Staurois parvus TaxID=386267 RepID=A0ABN9HEF3_9NEOB|nr:unnamed protein product [Staurois parvus]